MSRGLHRRLIALLSAAALCVAVPGAALANQGGVPHNTKACPSLPSQSKAKGPKEYRPNNAKGKKCGLQRLAA